MVAGHLLTKLVWGVEDLREGQKLIIKPLQSQRRSSMPQEGLHSEEFDFPVKSFQEFDGQWMSKSQYY